MKILIVFLCFILSSCAQRCSTEVDQKAAVKETVEKFVQLSAASKSLEDRKTLQSLSIGELKRAFENLSDEDFKAHYLGEKISIKELQIGEPEFEGDRARVRYIVTVHNTQGKASTAERNEREAVLSSSRGEWFIDTIRPVGSDQLAFLNGMIL